MAKSPFPIDPHLTGLAIAYKNDQYIADLLAPYRPVDQELFEWDEYTLAEMFTIPDTKVGRLSKPNEVTFSATRRQSSTEDYGLDAPVPRKDELNADANQDPLRYATEGVMELVKLDREARVASTVFGAATYPAGQKVTLSGTSQFSHASSTPIATVSDALDNSLIRPNTLVFGQTAWTKFRRHPEIVEAVLGTAAQKGMATREGVAELFEVDQVLVGRAWQNSAKPGQATSMTRLWGKHIAALYVNPQAQLRGTTSAPTFMLTARFGTPVAGAIEDPDMGLLGGQRVRAGEMVREVLVSLQGAYFWQNAVA